MMIKPNYRICIFENMGVVATKPRQFNDVVPRAPLVKSSRNHHCFQGTPIVNIWAAYAFRNMLAYCRFKFSIRASLTYAKTINYFRVVRNVLTEYFYEEIEFIDLC